MRPIAAMAAGVVLAAVFSTPVFADPAGPTDYRSEVVSVDPPSDDIDVEIIGGDSFVELTAQPGTDVVVVGYRGEPYLWFRPDGTVWENEKAPTTYQNLSRFGTDAPAAADPEAEPDWHQVASDHRWAWHDHRTHWMQTTRPLGAGARRSDPRGGRAARRGRRRRGGHRGQHVAASAVAVAGVARRDRRRAGRRRMVGDSSARPPGDALAGAAGRVGAGGRRLAVPVAAVGDGPAPRVVGAPGSGGGVLDRRGRGRAPRSPAGQSPVARRVPGSGPKRPCCWWASNSRSGAG